MKKKIIISVAFLLAIIILIALLTPLLVPKAIGENRLTGEYYENADGNDVIFLGDCEVYETFVPAILWEEYGISSYVRGTPQQLIWQSYYILEETFKYEKPKAVVFNVYSLKYGEPTEQSKINNRLTLDSMRWSKTKIDAINASMTEDENFIEYLIPFLAYHHRITELNKNDFEYWFKSPPNASDSGYLMQTGVEPAKATDGAPKEPLDLDFSQTAMDYLDKIKNICDANGCELILIKAPPNHPSYYWFEEYELQTEEYARKNGLKYYNLIEKENEIGIDWSKDTYDAGWHLNVYGAEKTSRYFGKILSEECGIADRRNDAELSRRWNNNLKMYKERKEIMEGEK